MGWTRIDGPLRPRAYDTARLEPGEAAAAGDWLAARTALLANADCTIAMGVLDAPMPYFFRNADRDELLFVHEGAGRLETDFGPLAYASGQYLVVDPAVLRLPTPGESSTAAPNAAGGHELRIVQDGEVTRVFYPFCPIDTVGWKGTLAAFALDVKDIRPVSSDRYHLPPPAHATFVASDVVICTFLPRPLENGDQAAMKVPFFHANVDYDELLPRRSR